MTGVTWLDDARVAHESLLRPSEVPPLFDSVTLETIDRPMFRTLASDYLTNFWTLAPLGRAPALLGRAGTFKSCTAALIATAVRRKALIDVAFVQCGPEFLRLEGRRFDEATDARLDWLGRAPFVVLDDFTKLRPGSWGADMLDAIVEKRYGNRRPTLFTGNVIVTKGDFAEITNHFGAGFSRRLQEGAAGLIAVAK